MVSNDNLILFTSSNFILGIVGFPTIVDYSNISKIYSISNFNSAMTISTILMDCF